MKKSIKATAVALTLTGVTVLDQGRVADALCPFARDGGAMPAGHPSVGSDNSNVDRINVDRAINSRLSPIQDAHRKAVQSLDWHAVKKDLITLFSTSHPSWPADYGNYAPFFIRLAWHCTGSYRSSDGRGGCDGGRQRFDPERSWDDNTNLDKARGLLIDIKIKYGDALSWGDLMVLAGTTAIEHMGGPVLGFCGGRIDDDDGSASELLGPTAEQEAHIPCEENGKCEVPFGSTTIGLIYVNPEGPMGKPDPIVSADQVRDTFGRMNMNDTETVALIGGGHAFGKTHGPCPDGPGLRPSEDPSHPWPGKCGSGKGKDAFTSGFEGPWTSMPTRWDNEYFKNLIDYDWKTYKGPGGHYQWGTSGRGPIAPAPHGNGYQSVMMLTSDISLTQDRKGEYQKIVQHFAQDQAALEDAFKHAWYKLTSRDMGPRARCIGPEVPPAQDWQHELPPSPPASELPNFDDVAKKISSVMHVQRSAGHDSAAVLVRLAWQCAATFRQTDYLGGCNGARIRFSPEKDWPINAGLDRALQLLAPVKDMYGDKLSWADLIALAGQTAIEEAGGRSMTFCGGRTDAADGRGSTLVKPILDGSSTDNLYNVAEYALRMGITRRELTALIGGGHSLGGMHAATSGYEGQWTKDPYTISNDYFLTLLTNEWEEVVVPRSDMAIKYDPEMLAIATEYASNNDRFLDDFSAAWTKVINADRFDGPHGSVCHQ